MTDEFKLIKRLGLEVCRGIGMSDQFSYVRADELEALLQLGYAHIVPKGEPEQILLYPKPADMRVQRSEIEKCITSEPVFDWDKISGILKRILEHGVVE